MSASYSSDGEDDECEMECDDMEVFERDASYCMSPRKEKKKKISMSKSKMNFNRREIDTFIFNLI